MELKEFIQEGLLSGKKETETIKTLDKSTIKSIISKYSELPVSEDFINAVKDLYYHKLDKEKELIELISLERECKREIDRTEKLLKEALNIVDIEFETKEKEVVYNKELVHHKALIQ